MTLAAEYREQFRWRSWSLLLDQLPLHAGQTVLDAGCAIGDQARQLAARGCRVIGLDANQELIDAALLDNPPHCDFILCDLRQASRLQLRVDGIWSSFAAAYFTDLASLLRSWRPLLDPGGWIAITEVDDLFGHEPLSPRTRSLLQSFTAEALAARRYDFHMGSKLPGCLAQAGFTLSQQSTLPDQELAFQGPATPDVIDAWRRRFRRLPALRALCGSEFESVQQEFLACLSRPDHISTAKVIACIATMAD